MRWYDSYRLNTIPLVIRTVLIAKSAYHYRWDVFRETQTTPCWRPGSLKSGRWCGWKNLLGLTLVFSPTSGWPTLLRFALRVLQQMKRQNSSQIYLTMDGS